MIVRLNGESLAGVKYDGALMALRSAFGKVKLSLRRGEQLLNVALHRDYNIRGRGKVMAEPLQGQPRVVSLKFKENTVDFGIMGKSVRSRQTDGAENEVAKKAVFICSTVYNGFPAQAVPVVGDQILSVRACVRAYVRACVCVCVCEVLTLSVSFLC